MLSAPRAGRYAIAAVQAALRGGFLRLWDTDMTSVMSQLIEQIRRARGLSACVLLAACVSLCGCRTSAIPSPPPGPPEAPASGTPVTQVRYAKGFIVEAADGFTRVTVTRPWPGAETVFEYILIPRGTRPPADVGEAQVVEVPVQRVIAMSTTHLPHVVMLGALDRLVGVGDISHVTNQEIRGLHDQGRIASVGHNGVVDLERLAAATPDLVFDASGGQPDLDNYDDMQKAGFTVAMNGEWVETTPLARAEWLKFSALFLGRGEEAERIFSAIEAEYTPLVQTAARASERPLVFSGSEFQGTWYVPGGQSFFAQFINDAAARYVWADDASTGSSAIDFEAVLARAGDAQYWFLHDGDHADLGELTAADGRYALLKAVNSGRVYCNDAQVASDGRNPYYEASIMAPQEVLADLIHILHPELLPDHRLIWYRRLPPGAAGRG